jgi:hypothetical protein
MLGKEADHECAYGNSRIAYFCGKSIASQPIAELAKSQASTQEDIPYVYDSVQVLFSADDEVITFTRMGEELTVTTVEGEFKGSTIQSLPVDVLNRLCGIQSSADLVVERGHEDE